MQRCCTERRLTDLCESSRSLGARVDGVVAGHDEYDTPERKSDRMRLYQWINTENTDEDGGFDSE